MVCTREPVTSNSIQNILLNNADIDHQIIRYPIQRQDKYSSDFNDVILP
jgi:hypothetical protein